MCTKKNQKLKIPADTFAVLAAAGGIFTAMAWPFFRFITYAGKKDGKASASNKKKWFSLKHTTVNHPRYKHEEEYLATRTWCENQPMKDIFIHSRDGLKLHASYLPAENARRIVLLSHGYRGSSFGSIAHMAEYLHENNCDLLFIDQRCCGKSEGNYITFGAKEQYDIIDWTGLLSRNNPKRLPIYLYGQSMGATTVLLASGHRLPTEVKGLIADCGFHSMKQQLRDIASGWFHLHWIELLLLRVDLFCHLFAGFGMKETDTTEALRKNRRPVLFFHGEDDTYVWPENSKLNYNICTAPKKLVLIPGARHLCSSYEAPELYKEKIMQLFRDCEVETRP